MSVGSCTSVLQDRVLDGMSVCACWSVFFIPGFDIHTHGTARVVNAAYQQDALHATSKGYSNVMVLATTNLTGKVDSALLDRADIKAFVGLPSLHARYEILRSCLQVPPPPPARCCCYNVVNPQPRICWHTKDQVARLHR